MFGREEEGDMSNLWTKEREGELPNNQPLVVRKKDEEEGCPILDLMPTYLPTPNSFSFLTPTTLGHPKTIDLIN